MANAPDVRVRLTAEGVAEVVNAFKRVQDEAQKVRPAGFNQLNAALGSLKSLLPAISVGAVVTGFVAMTKRSMELADSLGKLNQKTGITTETLSVLSFASRTADVEQDALARNLIRFARAMDEYDKGAKDTRTAIKGLFNDSRALMGLNQDQRLLKVVDALAKLEPGAKRTGAAFALFGKSGAELLPLIDDLGSGGFDVLRKKAEKLGLVVGQDLAKAAQRAKDAMTDLKSQVEGMTMRFASGFAPALAGAAKATAEVPGPGINAFQKLGEVAGSVLRGIMAGFFAVSMLGAQIFAALAVNVRATFELLSDWMHGHFKGSLDKYRATVTENMDVALKNIRDKYEKSLKDLYRIPEPAPRPRRDTGASEDEAAEAERKRLAREAEAAKERARKAALELSEARRYYNTRAAAAEMKDQEATEQERYEKGLISLREYYAGRIALAERQGKAEAEALYGKVIELMKSPLGKDEHPYERQAKIVKAAADFQAKALENATDLKRLKAEEARETEQLQQQALDFERKIRELQGDRFEQTRSAIEEEAQQLDEILRRLGVAEDERLERVSALRAAGYRQVETERQQSDFESLENQAMAALDDLERKRRRIDLEVQSGQLFAYEGERKIVDLERGRLPLLRQIADAMRAAAVTPEQIQQAEEFQLKIAEISVVSDKSARDMAYFKQSVEAAATSDLSNWLSSGIEQAESFGDAFRGLALSVVQSMRQIAAQMLATLMIQKMLGFFGFAGGASPAPAPGKAAGGLIRGPGTGTSDSIAARLSNYEYVIRAAVVKQPGMLELLNAINFGTPRIRRPAFPRFADGGLVDATASSSSGKANLTATLGLDEGLLLKHLEASPEFHRVFVRIAQNNQKAIKRVLGG